MEHILNLIFLILMISTQSAFSAYKDAVYLPAGSRINVTKSYGYKAPRVVCYQGKPYSVISLFETVEFILTIDSDDFAEYGGDTPQEVMEHYNEKRSLFSITLFSQKRRRIEFSPFEDQCIGIETRHPYNIVLQQNIYNYYRALQFIAGIAVFWSAGQLAKNSVFYYLAGIVLGICASLLVIIALTSKLFPQRPMMYGMLIGGWTVGLYIIKQLMDNVQLILLTYRQYVLWYIGVTGLISFLFCYRVGPPSNPRSQNIIKWVLQAIGGAILYTSSWHTSACVCALVITFIAYHFPMRVLIFVQRFYRRRFPKKRRFLTQAEYHKQTVNETARALSDLRYYVNSGNCSQWHIVSALRDPLRFASFANGAPHLYDEEIEDYSRTIDRSIAGVGEEEAKECLQCNMNYRPPIERRLYRHQQMPMLRDPLPPRGPNAPLFFDDDLDDDDEEEVEQEN